MEWCIDWNAAGAIGTVLTGIGAAFIAVKANKLAKKIAKRDKQRSDRAARAYAIGALYEISSMRDRAVALLPYANAVASDNVTGDAEQLVFAASKFPPFAPSAQISQSPAIGALPKSLGTEIAEFVALANETGMFIGTLVSLPSGFHEEGRHKWNNAIFSSLHEKLTELTSRAAALEPQLRGFTGVGIR
jgi:hypothetical protein